MRLVVDVNVVLSSLLKKGTSFRVFALNSILRKFEFITPDFMISEFEKHRTDILHKSALSEDVFDDVLELIFEQVEIIPSEEFGSLVPTAMKHLGSDSKDVPYLALALRFNCEIFSGDKELRKLSPVKVYSPKELLKLLLRRA